QVHDLLLGREINEVHASHLDRLSEDRIRIFTVVEGSPAPKIRATNAVTLEENPQTFESKLSWPIRRIPRSAFGHNSALGSRNRGYSLECFTGPIVRIEVGA